MHLLRAFEQRSLGSGVYGLCLTLFSLRFGGSPKGGLLAVSDHSRASLDELKSTLVDTGDEFLEESRYLCVFCGGRLLFLSENNDTFCSTVLAVGKML